MAYVELDQLSDLDIIRMFQPVVGSDDVQVAANKAQPTGYVIGNASMTFWPWPDDTYTIRCLYWKDMAPPDADSVDGFSNAWIRDYPGLYEQELTAHGFRYLGEDSKALIWENRAKGTLADVRAANVARELAGPGKLALVPNLGVYGTTRGRRANIWRTRYY